MTLFFQLESSFPFPVNVSSSSVPEVWKDFFEGISYMNWNKHQEEKHLTRSSTYYLLTHQGHSRVSLWAYRISCAKWNYRLHKMEGNFPIKEMFPGSPLPIYPLIVSGFMGPIGFLDCNLVVALFLAVDKEKRSTSLPTKVQRDFELPAAPPCLPGCLPVRTTRRGKGSNRIPAQR